MSGASAAAPPPNPSGWRATPLVGAGDDATGVFMAILDVFITKRCRAGDPRRPACELRRDPAGDRRPTRSPTAYR